MEIRFHHLGLATRNPDRARGFLRTLGYDADDLILDPLQNVRLCLFTSPTMPAVEVITPAQTPGPLDSILAKTDTAPYHYCYETPRADHAIAHFQEGGARVICVSEPKPAVLFDGRLVSFHLVQGFGLIELLQSA